jgi:hypothetical protein
MLLPAADRLVNERADRVAFLRAWDGGAFP